MMLIVGLLVLGMIACEALANTPTCILTFWGGPLNKDFMGKCQSEDGYQNYIEVNTDNVHLANVMTITDACGPGYCCTLTVGYGICSSHTSCPGGFGTTDVGSVTIDDPWGEGRYMYGVNCLPC